MTHNEAIAHLIATNDEAAAFAIAQQDGNLLPSVTIEIWAPFARQCIANRQADAAVDYNSGWA